MSTKKKDFTSRSQRERQQKSFENHKTHSSELTDVLIQDVMTDIRTRNSEANNYDRTRPSSIRGSANLIRLIKLQDIFLGYLIKTRYQKIEEKERMSEFLDKDPVARALAVQFRRRLMYFFNTGNIKEVE